MAEAAQLGVKFLDHREAARQHVTNIAAWAKLVGYKDYERSVWLTLRPYIIHPVGENPLDDWRTIAHELVHFRQQPEGWPRLWMWIIRYGCSQDFRWRMEREAHLVNLRLGQYRDIARLVESMKTFYRLSGITAERMVAWFEQNRS